MLELLTLSERLSCFLYPLPGPFGHHPGAHGHRRGLEYRPTGKSWSSLNSFITATVQHNTCVSVHLSPVNGTLRYLIPTVWIKKHATRCCTPALANKHLHTHTNSTYLYIQGFILYRINKWKEALCDLLHFSFHKERIKVASDNGTAVLFIFSHSQSVEALHNRRLSHTPKGTGVIRKTTIAKLKQLSLQTNCPHYYTNSRVKFSWRGVHFTYFDVVSGFFFFVAGAFLKIWILSVAMLSSETRNCHQSKQAAMRRHTCVYRSVPAEIFLHNAATEERDRTRIESAVYVLFFFFLSDIQHTQRDDIILTETRSLSKHHLPVFCYSFDGATLGFASKYGCREVKHQNLFSRRVIKKLHSCVRIDRKEMHCLAPHAQLRVNCVFFFHPKQSTISVWFAHTTLFRAVRRNVNSSQCGFNECMGSVQRFMVILERGVAHTAHSDAQHYPSQPSATKWS